MESSYGEYYIIGVKFYAKILIVALITTMSLLAYPPVIFQMQLRTGAGY